MGAKRLKAIVVDGHVRTPLADQERVVALSRALSKRSLGASTAKYRELGTVANLATFNRMAALPTRNFQSSRFDDAERIGHGAARIAPHVKGLEIPGYEPRALQTQALGFALGTRGADHNRTSGYEADFSQRVQRMHGGERSAELAIESEDRAALIDWLILCKFLRGAFEDLHAESAEILAAVTGWDVSANELRQVATRIVALRMAYNIREGWTPKDDTLPDRFLEEALTEGASRGASLPRSRLRKMIRHYNVSRGWTDDGYLPDAVLKDLALDATGKTIT